MEKKFLQCHGDSRQIKDSIKFAHSAFQSGPKRALNIDLKF